MLKELLACGANLNLKNAVSDFLFESVTELWPEKAIDIIAELAIQKNPISKNGSVH
jgi:hypothetical protein